ncbi:MAG: hemerythrin domain-containing protein [Gammaproteobacteria bacterium]|jgi:hemerythrin-like domain-containing protein|nr:hemerythrin domain-containing protein [Gammaproteobacteria bacterium]MBT4605515.1 hemerythrin domain-containing protein [Thiotrichales bacterium]MBT3472293.1 hemerythrin domain-containing protein [Gammaproteobacteria bacterium]MBT3968328.1 hemerythrin domain-containing protein [Gammaproteobacteria bacterium]MBT4079774.1 hemerythrin domain-containing protein [Gammaproteobacteria bacterium]
MEQISTIMTNQHRLCDDHFAALENAASTGDWETAESAWKRFNQSMLDHFDNEESLLFPAFESMTGNTQGPTQMMRMEHKQMRSLLEGLQQAVENHYTEQVLGVADTIMLMIQQHNMKEEQILYPMIDNAVGESPTVREQLKSIEA